jgi:tripartite-type tricarboxylate transporter receptor subunit TctC
MNGRDPLGVVFVLLAGVISWGFWGGFCHSSVAQSYPEKSVTLIAPFSAGGSVDMISRAVALQMGMLWKQSVIVSNRPGASGMIGVEAVVRSAPDGYSLLMATTALSSSPSLFTKLSFDPIRDLAPISLVVTMSNVLVVHPFLPVNSVQQLLALAKRHPDQLTSASAGMGSSNHLALVLFNRLGASHIGHVPYKGAAPALTDVMGGHVTMTFAPIAAIVSSVKSHRLKALALTASSRSAVFPQLPTLAEAGLKGYESVGWNGLFAPQGLTKEMIGKINTTLRLSLNSAKVQEVIVAGGADAVGSSVEGLEQFLKQEVIKWRDLIQSAGIKGDE